MSRIPDALFLVSIQIKNYLFSFQLSYPLLFSLLRQPFSVHFSLTPDIFDL